MDKIKILIVFILIQIGLENLYFLFPVENYAQLHTAITAGIVDNIIPAFLLFWVCLKYIKEPFLVIISLVWFVIKIIDGVVRVFLQFAIYFADNPGFAYQINEWLIFTYWLYVLIPIGWLILIRRNFIIQPSDTYGKGTYLFFKRPMGISDYLIALFGGATSTVFPVVNGYYYHFNKGQPFTKNKFEKDMLEKGRLIKINPPKEFKGFLESKIGVAYELINCNCVTVMRGSGIKIGFWDFIPAVFVLRFK